MLDWQQFNLTGSCLARESSELVHARPTGLSIGGDDDVLDRTTSSAISSSFQGTETESMDIKSAEVVHPFEQRLQGVEKSIDRLYRLSLQIRKPSIAQQNAKAERFPIVDEEGNRIDKEFAQFAADIVTHQFPECNETLRQRLARGIVVRRRRFLYRQRHQRKLNAKTVVALVDSDREKKMTASLTNAESTVRGVRVMVDESPQALSNGIKPKVTFPPSQTSASRMVKSPIAVEKIFDEVSRISGTFTNTSTTANPIMVPNPPAPAPGSKEFECPYCCIFLSISNAKASRWR